MSQLLSSPAPNAPLAPSFSPRRLLLSTALASIALAVVGAVALRDPGHAVCAEPDSALARVMLSPGAVAATVLALGLLGTVVAVLVRLRPAGPGVVPVLGVTAVIQVLAGGVALPSVTSIVLAGYLLALALPFGLVCLGVQVVRRYPRWRWPTVGVVLALAGWGVLTGTARPEHLAGLAGDLGAGFAAAAEKLFVTLVLGASTACWVAVAVRSSRSQPSTRRFGEWVLRHRVGLTVVAAAGPLPYGLIRASWLTPWPLLSPAGEVLDPELRLWGLLLGGGALLGSVLTLGLIRSWGVVFPRWMPRLAGHSVPVRAATVPGGLVAGLVSASAVPMLRMMWSAEPGTVFSAAPLLDRILAVVVFPFWVWGPALALAVWGYALSRHPAGPTTGTRD